MHSLISTAAVALAASSLVAAAPTNNTLLQQSNKQNSKIIQLPGNFPVLSQDNIAKVEAGAFGQLSNLKGSGKPFQSDTVTSIELIALNEIIESFFFENFLNQLDNSTFTRTLHELDVTEGQLKASIESIFNVEELHAINANNALVNVVKTNPIVPCQFIFPVDDVKSAVQLANRFTDVVDGLLQDVIVKAALAGDAGFTPGVASASQDEAEQNGGFRTWLHERAQSQPFLTTGSRDFGYSLLQDFIVPGTCGMNKDKIDLQVLQPLVADDPSANNQDITFKFDVQQKQRLDNFNGPAKTNSFIAKPKPSSQCEGLFVTYINGLSIVSEPVKKCSFGQGATGSEVTAFFPQEQNDIFGSVIAVITNSDSFNSVDDVIKANVFGFAALEVQEKPLF